jgi:hydrogenase/urease accessory protein HupE
MSKHMRCSGARAVWLACLAMAAGTASAHPLAPALLELREIDEGRVEVLWKTSSTRVPGSNVQPVLPPRCTPLGAPRREPGPASVVTRLTLDCGDEGLVGAEVGVTDLEAARISALLRLELADGRSFQRMLRADAPLATVPDRESFGQVLRSYGALGVEHILTGLDHLLFVLGLLLLVDGARRLAATVTAFTVGHSVTLSLAVLGIADLPTGPIELAIAFSVFLLALELSRGAESPPSPMRRRPWGVAGAFGLLHGMGFAGALSEVGLPQADIPLALFSFNVGIEIGQLTFILAVLVAGWILRRPLLAMPAWTGQVPVYALGTLAAFWCYERAAALWP